MKKLFLYHGLSIIIPEENFISFKDNELLFFGYLQKGLLIKKWFLSQINFG